MNAALVRLSSSLLHSTHIRRPLYDRAGVSTGIVHIGVGGFHRSHQALYVEELIEKHDAVTWGICGAGILPADQKMKDAMQAQDCLYTLVERSAAGDSARVIGSILEYIWGPESPEVLIEQLASARTRIVSLTITEGGYCFNQGTGEFNHSAPGIVHDLDDPQAPQTAFGYLTEALARRRARGIRPFTVLSCDNLQSNGEICREMLLSFAELRDSELCEWIGENVAFPSSMVDRITPAATESDREMVASKFGILDACPVVCEPFRQWVIEDRFCNGRPAWEEVGVQMTKDVHPYELMKIRLLNAGHSAMGYLGYLAGYRYINEIMNDPQFRRYILELMDEEVTPLLRPVHGVNLTEYKKTLIERFANPTVKDQALRICMDGSSKMPKFILPSIREQLRRGTVPRRLVLAVASWFRFLSGVDEEGREIPISDPMAARLREAASAGRSDPRPLLSLRELFGDLTDSKPFVDELKATLEALYVKGSRAVLSTYVGEAQKEQQAAWM